jgi:hypothetical protein
MNDKTVLRSSDMDILKEEKYIQRMTLVHNLSKEVTSLKSSFSKKKVQEFLNVKENLILLEHFLALSNELIYPGSVSIITDTKFVMSLG